MFLWSLVRDRHQPVLCCLCPWAIGAAQWGALTHVTHLMCALNQVDHTWMKSSGIKLYTVWRCRGIIHSFFCFFTETASPHGIPTAAGPEEAPALSSVQVPGEFRQCTWQHNVFLHKQQEFHLQTKHLKNTTFCVVPLFKYTCEIISVLRETVLLSFVCKYRLSAGILRSKLAVMQLQLSGWIWFDLPRTVNLSIDSVSHNAEKFSPIEFHGGKMIQK